jgi:carbamoyl-phosphate synthase large subunit
LEALLNILITSAGRRTSLVAAFQKAARPFGHKVLVADFEPLARDKWMASQYFKTEGIDVPATWLPDVPVAAVPAEIFLKPRYGSASSNTCRCKKEDLHRKIQSIPNALIQEFPSGMEITVDSFLDFQEPSIHFVPRERIRTLAGESIQGVTLDRPELEPWVESVLQACSQLGAKGPLTLKAFLTDRRPVLTEVNPRFRGGFPWRWPPEPTIPPGSWRSCGASPWSQGAANIGVGSI